VTTAVIAGPPVALDVDVSSPAGGEGEIIVVELDGEARADGTSMTSPAGTESSAQDADHENVTVVSSPAQPASPAKSLTSTHVERGHLGDISREGQDKEEI
jgi:hypothetical protein